LADVTRPQPASAADPVEAGVDELPEQMRVRRAKLDRLRAAGIDPYPPGFPRTTTNAALRDRFAELAPDTATGQRVGVTGRVMLNRLGGKLCFATLRDGTGDLQVMLSLDRPGADALAGWKADVDLGDLIGVEGEVITSRRGELSVLADRWAITAKALRPLPEKFRGLTDPEARVRQRYLDLIVNPDARLMLAVRSAAVAAVRAHLTRQDFVEVETPMLQPVHGGATARPFVTHMNALDLRLYLRIAPELYLKRLLVGGVERVFEINRSFRNEGVDSSHNPEFTMLEAYAAYGDYESMLTLTRELVQQAAEAAFGSTVVRHRDGSEHDLGGRWRTMSVNAAISATVGEQVDADSPIEELRAHCARIGIALQPQWNRGQVVLEMYERLVEERTVAPTFYRDFPTEVSPLTRAHRRDPRLAERWDLVAFGREIATAYTELIDPVEQRSRLQAQSLLAAGGDPEAMVLDEDFLRALEYGMPPAGGMGLGIDRLLMMLTGANIRETILFPLVRPQS
jgi:lysyl-tRNA synthetase class 2